MGVKTTELRQIYIQLNVELEAKQVVAVLWRGGEAIRQKRRLGGGMIGSTFIVSPSEQ
jgi:hypothetical protein